MRRDLPGLLPIIDCRIICQMPFFRLPGIGFFSFCRILYGPADQGCLVCLPGRAVRSDDRLKIPVDACVAQHPLRHFLGFGSDGKELFAHCGQFLQHLLHPVVQGSHVDAFFLIMLTVIDDCPVRIFLIKMVKVLKGFKQGRTNELFQFFAVLSLDPELFQGIDDRIHDPEFRLHQGPVQVKEDPAVIGLYPAGQLQRPAQVFIALIFLFFGKVNLAELLGIAFIRQVLALELLAGNVKHMPVHIIIAVESAPLARDAVYLSPENILYQKSRDRALPGSNVPLAVPLPQAGRTGIFAPDTAEYIIKILGRADPGIDVTDCRHIRIFISVKYITHEYLSPFSLK